MLPVKSGQGPESTGFCLRVSELTPLKNTMRVPKPDALEYTTPNDPLQGM